MSRLHRLTGNDSFFLLGETPDQPMHYVTLLSLGPEERPGRTPAQLSLDELSDFLSDRLQLVPALRWRIKPVPMGLGHPVAFDDPDFDLTHHIAQASVADPGGRAELDALVARLAEWPLDRSRPLWRLALVSGLAGGGQALLLQVHHALMDGAATLNVASVLFSESTPAPPAEPAARPGREPGGLRLLAGAIGSGIRRNFRFPGLLWRSVRGGLRVRARQKAGAIRIPLPGRDTPACIVNCPPGRGRRFARGYLPLADVKAVKDAAGATVNDVALALCAGALRDYLEARGRLPQRSLVAAIPVGIDTADHSRRSGNRWSGLATTLATDVADPWERLGRITAVTRESKHQLGLIGVTLLEQWVDFFPPFLAASAVAKERRDAADPDHVRFNLALSNLRRPGEPLVISVPAGRWQIDEVFFTAVPANRQGLSIVCMDQGDQLTFGVFSTADAMDDPTEFVTGLRRALAELVKAMEALPAAGDRSL